MLSSKLPAHLPSRPTKMGYERRPITASGLILAGAVCSFALAASGQTGSRLPPTPPTSISNPNPLTPPIAATPARLDTAKRHRARVTYADGLLEVRADDSSLNQILRDISRQTGMKVVGGVADQRVYGSYGPAPAVTVLQTLLGGTGTNILLQESATHAPEQLVLTPQTGGPTPPPPSSPTYDATEAEPELPIPGAVQRAGQAQTAAQTTDAAPASATALPTTTSVPSTPPSMPQPSNNVLGDPNNVSPTASTLPVTNSVPINTLPTPSTVPPVSGIVDAPNPPPAGSTTAGFTNQTPPNNNPNTAPPATATTDQSSPNGVKTPEQIYEELRQLQQKKANPQGSSAPQ